MEDNLRVKFTGDESAETPQTSAGPATERQQVLAAFEHYTEQFVKALTNYTGSKSQLVRAWANSSISPLNREPLHFSYKHEQDLFDLFAEANSAKLMLMVHGLEDAGVVKLLKPLVEATPPNTEVLMTEEAIKQEEKGV